jgi:hypothetical protein
MEVATFMEIKASTGSSSGESRWHGSCDFHGNKSLHRQFQRRKPVAWKLRLSWE